MLWVIAQIIVLSALSDDGTLLGASLDREPASSFEIRSAEFSESVRIVTDPAPDVEAEADAMGRTACEEQTKSLVREEHEDQTGGEGDSVLEVVERQRELHERMFEVRELNRDLQLDRTRRIDFSNKRERQDNRDSRDVPALIARFGFSDVLAMNLDQTRSRILTRKDVTEMVSRPAMFAIAMDEPRYAFHTRLLVGMLPDDVAPDTHRGNEEIDGVRIRRTVRALDSGHVRHRYVLRSDLGNVVEEYEQVLADGRSEFRFVARDFKQVDGHWIAMHTEVTRPGMAGLQAVREVRTVRSVRLNVELAEDAFEVGDEYVRSDARTNPRPVIFFRRTK